MVTKVTKHTSSGRKKIGREVGAQQKPRMKRLGKMKHLHKENERLNKRVEKAFEKIDWEI